MTAGQRHVLAAWVAGTVIVESSWQTLVAAAVEEALGTGHKHGIRPRSRVRVRWR
ncbi:MAG: hypothetical protein HYX51_09805 [Chloroflexi bacterium]|nr:hypothetical protein [Chloroflexota bacterium]